MEGASKSRKEASDRRKKSISMAKGKFGAAMKEAIKKATERAQNAKRRIEMEKQRMIREAMAKARASAAQVDEGLQKEIEAIKEEAQKNLKQTKEEAERREAAELALIGSKAMGAEHGVKERAEKALKVLNTGLIDITSLKSELDEIREDFARKKTANVEILKEQKPKLELANEKLQTANAYLAATRTGTGYSNRFSPQLGLRQQKPNRYQLLAKVAINEARTILQGFDYRASSPGEQRVGSESEVDIQRERAVRYSRDIANMVQSISNILLEVENLQV